LTITAADAIVNFSAASERRRLYHLIRFIDRQWRSSGSGGNRQDEECRKGVGRCFIAVTGTPNLMQEHVA